MPVFNPLGEFPIYPGAKPDEQLIKSRAYIKRYPDYGRIGVPTDWFYKAKDAIRSYHNWGIRTSRQVFRRVGEGVPETPKPPAPSEPTKEMRFSRYPSGIYHTKEPVNWTYMMLNGRKRRVGLVGQSYFEETGLGNENTIGLLYNGDIYLAKNIGNRRLSEDELRAIGTHEDLHDILKNGLKIPEFENLPVGAKEYLINREVIRRCIREGNVPGAELANEVIYGDKRIHNFLKAFSQIH